MSIFPQNKLNLAVHVFIVDGFASFKVDATPDLEGLLVKSRPSELVQDVFLRENPVQDATTLFDVCVLDEHGPRDELQVAHFA